MSFLGNVYIPNANALTAAGDVYLNNLHISGTTTINGDLNISGTSTIGDIYAKNISVENLTVSGASNLDIVNAIYTTVLSSINISGTATLTAIDATSAIFNDFLTVTGKTILNNETTINSSLNVSGQTTLQGSTSLLSSLNVSGQTTLQGEVTLLSSLNVSGNSSITGSLTVTGLTTLNNQTTVNSSLNVSGKTTLQGMSTLLSSLNVSGLTLLGNQTTVNSSLNISGKTTLQGATTLLSSLNTSGNSTLQGATTLLSTLNVSGQTTLQGTSTLLSSLNVSGNSTLQGSTTLLSTLNVSGQTSLQGDTSLLASIFVSGQSLLQGDSYLLAGINVSGTSTLKGAVSVNSTLNVSGNTTIQGIVTLLSSLNVSGLTQIQGATSLHSTLNVSGNTTLQGAASVLSNLSVSGITHLQGNTVLESTLYVSGKSLLQGETTLLSNLNVSGQSMLQGNVDILGTLNVSGKSTLTNDVTLSSTLNVSGQSNLQGDVNLLSSLTVSGTSTLLNYVTLNSGLNVSGQTTLMGDVYIDSELVVKEPTTLLSTLNVGSNTTIEGSTTINSTLSVNDILRVNTINPYSDLYTNETDPNQIINIVGHVINIGGPNSHINIAGTTTSIITTEINVNDPLIVVNTVPGLDNLYGNSSGIQMNGISGVGYLKTDMNATGFLIKAPMSDLVAYIATKDGSENIFVTGASLIYGNITGLSDINISGKAYLHGPTTLDSQLYVSGSSLFQGGVSMDSTLNVSGLTLLQGATTLLSSLNVSGQTVLQGSTTLLSSINVSGKSVLNGDVTLNSNLAVNGSTFINGATTVNSTLNVSNNLTVTGQLNVDNGINMSGPTNVQSLTATGTLTVSGVSVLQGYVTMISGLNVNANTILQGSTTNSSSLNVSGQTTLQGSTTLLSSINISGQTNLQGATTLLSSLNVSGLTLLGGNTTVVSSLNVSGKTTLLGATTMASSLNVSGQTTLGNQTTLVSTLNISGKSTLQGEVTLMSSLNVSGVTLLQGATTLLSSLNVSGNSTLQGFTSLLSSLNVSGLTSLQGNTTINSSLNVSGKTSLQGNTTLLSNLNVSGLTQLNNSTTIMSTLNVSGLSTLNNVIVNNDTILNNLSVSGNAILNNMTILSTLNISGLTSLNNVNVSGISLLNNLNVSGTSNMNNMVVNNGATMLSTLNVSGLSMMNTANISNLNVMNSLMNVNTVILGSTVTTLESASTIVAGAGISSITIPTAGTYKANITNFATSGALNFNPSLNLVSGSNYTYSFTLQTSSGMSGNVTLTFTDGTNTLATINPTSTLTTYTGSFTATTNNIVYLNLVYSTTAISAWIQWTDFNLSGIQNTGTTITTMYMNKLGVGMTNPSALFQVSGTSILNGTVTISSNLNVSGQPTLQGATTLLSSLYVSGLTNINNSLIVAGSSTVGTTMNVVGDINFGGKLYKNGSEFTGNPTTLSYLNITNGLTVYNSLNVSGYSVLNGATTIPSSLNVNSLNVTNMLTTTNINNSGTSSSALNVSGGSIVPNVGISSVTYLSNVYKAQFSATSGVLVFNPAIYCVSGASYTFTFTGLSGTSGVGFYFMDGVGTSLSSTVYPSLQGPTYTGTFTAVSNNQLAIAASCGFPPALNSFQWATFSLATVSSFNTQISTVYLAGNVGIGNTNPSSLLQFANTLNNRDIVLWDNGSSSTDHQYYGFGINPNTLRYQTASTGANHVFYAATSATTSSMLMCINGNGNVGIGISAPTAQLHTYGGTSNNLSLMLSSAGPGWASGLQMVNSATNARNYGMYAGSDGLWHFADCTANTDRMVVNGNGFMGFGTLSPLALHHLSSTNANQSGYGSLLVDTPNAGAAGGTITIRNSAGGNGAFASLAFEVDGSTATNSSGTTPTAYNYANGFIYCQNTSSSSNASKLGFQLWSGSTELEVMTMLPTGNVGIGTTSPAYPLSVNGHFQVINATNDVMGLFSPSYGNYIHIGSWNAAGAYSKNLVLQQFGGYVGIGTTAPVAPLHIQGGDNSKTYYGPNTSWGGAMYVGAGTNNLSSGTCQAISTNGNLHLDAGYGKNVYINHYANGGDTNYNPTNYGNTTIIYGTTKVYGNGSIDGGASMIVQNASAASDAYARLFLLSNSGGGCHWWLNSSNRTADGGANTATIRNDSGSMRLYSNGGGLFIQATTGAVNVMGNNTYAVLNSYMARGSLTIGSTTDNYGGGTYWNGSTAGLMMECLDSTEMAIHDAGNRIVSTMYYSGNRIYVGRDMGYGTTPVSFKSNVSIAGEGDLTARLCITNPNGSISHFGYSNNWNYLRGAHLQVDSTATITGDLSVSSNVNSSYSVNAGSNVIANGSLAVVHSAATWDHINISHDGSCAYFNAGGAETGISFGSTTGNSGYPSNVAYTEYLRINPNDNTTYYNTAGHVFPSAQISQGWDRLLVYANGWNTNGGYFFYNLQNNYGAASDARMKENFEQISVDKSKQFIKLLKPTSYSMKHDTDATIIDGFVAQDVLEAANSSGISKSAVNNWEKYEEEINLPEEERKAMLGLSDRPIITHLVNTVKSLLDDNDNLKQENIQLKQQMANLQEQNVLMKSQLDRLLAWAQSQGNF